MRTPDIAVISDCHLGTRHCRADELFTYLNQIRPKRLIINGDLCDLGHYFTRHWPRRHQEILKRILELAGSGTEVIYVIGNHDAPLRGFMDLLPGLRLVPEYQCNYDGLELLFTHGHRFDAQLCGLRWLKQLGGLGYEALQWAEWQGNRLLRWAGFAPRRWVTALKHSIPGANRVINRFEDAAIYLALKEGLDVICCGHIHVPRIDVIDLGGRRIRYINTGDWVEHCTAVEATDGVFALHGYAAGDRSVLVPVLTPAGIEAA
jgi:UDP-2,3-diacylglucosamine pyrophosphatase LpxH